MRVRRATAIDIPAIMCLELEAASAAHWPKQHYDNMFLSAPNSLSERCVWIAEDDRDRLDGRRTQPKVLGFLVAHRMESECELENVVVSIDSRCKGVGTLLLDELLRYARESLVSRVFLEVRESNYAARHLYERAGFEITGLRKNYYSQPAENAVLYRLNLC